MRRTIALSLAAAVVFSVGAPRESSVAKAPRDKLVCSPSTNDGRFANGECILPRASLGQSYEGFILTSNGDGGYFSIAAGRVPPGLSMPHVYGAAGTIVARTPTTEGTFAFTVKGVDQDDEPLRETYSITVGPPPLVDTTPTVMAAGRVGHFYRANFFLSGGAPYSWALASGRLPPGLKLVSTDGPADNNDELAGTPTEAGQFAFTMKVTDHLGHTATGHESVTIRPSLLSGASLPTR